VPLYQAFIEAARKYGSIVHMTEDELFNATEARQSWELTLWQSIPGSNNIHP